MWRSDLTFRYDIMTLLKEHMLRNIGALIFEQSSQSIGWDEEGTQHWQTDDRQQIKSDRLLKRLRALWRQMLCSLMWTNEHKHLPYERMHICSETVLCASRSTLCLNSASSSCLQHRVYPVILFMSASRTLYASTQIIHNFQARMVHKNDRYDGFGWNNSWSLQYIYKRYI